MLSERFIKDGMRLEKNIYLIKSYLHLKMLIDSGANLESVSFYLGNDEFSDSYLLDMFCNKNCPECFKTLQEILSSDTKKLSNITREKYEELRS